MTELPLTGNAKKQDQLGMHHGTAASRLRKLVLFRVLQKYNENVCYRCEKTIDTPEELSIEHKEPWLDSDPALFWDLENIAFSHLKCNIRAARRVVSQAMRDSLVRPRKIGPEGTAWCQGHHDFLPTEKFSSNKYHWNGLQKDCIECRSRKRSKRIKAG